MQPFEMNSNSRKPFISVAMAAYNGGQFIAEQLDSVLSQTVANIEIIIVDDFSTDDTKSILIGYQQKDERVRLFFNKENTGYRQTFYNALQHCQGEYILFCDQDDIWVENKIETLLLNVEDNLLVFSDSALISEQGKNLGVKLSDTVCMRQPGQKKINRGFVIGNCVWGHTIMFHKSLLEYTAADGNTHPHDWWFAVVSSHLNKIKYCPSILNYYRQHSGNVTQAIPVKTGRVAGRKLSEFETQLSRVESIAALSFNSDRDFYLRWKQLSIKRKNGFSIPFFWFLIANRKDIFSLKRKGSLSQIIEIRKMCRKLN